MLSYKVLVKPIGEGRGNLHANGKANAQRDAIQPADADILAVDALSHTTEGAQDQVEEAKQVRHVKRDNLNDGLAAHQNEGSHQRHTHEFP